jgi:hypothetical protein
MKKTSLRHLPLILPRTLLMMALASFLLVSGNAAPTEPEPRLAVSVDHAILRAAESAQQPAKAHCTVTPINFPAGSALIYEWKQVQDVLLPGAAKMAEKPIRFDATNQPSVEASFPASGVYEIEVTVKDTNSTISARRNTWVNVWDNKPALSHDGKPDPLTTIPGMIPPPSVRNVEPEPGPFIHPRLLCSPSDWGDIHSRAVEGKSKIAAAGWRPLNDAYKQGISTNSSEGKFLQQLEAYQDSSGKAPYPDLTFGSGITNGGYWNGFEPRMRGLLGNLSEACFTQWLKVDPSKNLQSASPEDQALCRNLAKQVASVSAFLLENSWDRKTGEFKTNAPGYIKNLETPGEAVGDSYIGMALAYDFSAPWMTEAEQQETRDFLIAIGRGRMGPGQGIGHSSQKNHAVQRGFEQNGTFGVWGEPMEWLSLVVSGEESKANPLVVKTFLNPPKPKDYEKLQSKNPCYDIVRPADFTSDGGLPISQAYPDASIWPHALKSDVNCLQKEIWTFQDTMISPWGFTLERLAYFGFITADAWPVAYTLARFGGFNQFVGGPYYQTVNNWIYTMYPGGAAGPNGVISSASFSSDVGIYEHHSGGGDYRQQFILFLKHMYPDDPVVDYAYAAQASELEQRAHSRINSCIFGVDPGIKNLTNALAPIAEAHELPLTKLDPYLGIAVMRSGWKDDDMELYFDGGHPVWGHMNAEHGSFTLLALGRHWSVPSGYHKTLGNFQSLIQCQNPAWAACPYTQGFISESPSFVPDVPGCDYFGGFPTASAHLLEVTESSDRRWSTAACDITVPYNYTCSTPKGATNKPMACDLNDFMYPGLSDYLKGIDPLYVKQTANFFPVPESCRIQHAIRSVLMVRGKHPYVLVVDDFRKGDAPANYRWVLSDKIKMKDEGRFTDPKDESYCVQMAPGSTATEATLYHQRDKEIKTGQEGLPRLLVKDLSENNNSSQPPAKMVLSTFKLPEAKYSKEECNELFLERNQVIDPRFKVLLYPYRTGEKPPSTTWDKDHTRLTISFDDGSSDIIHFDHSNPDHRTRLELKHAKAKE